VRAVRKFKLGFAAISWLSAARLTSARLGGHTRCVCFKFFFNLLELSLEPGFELQTRGHVNGRASFRTKQGKLFLLNMVHFVPHTLLARFKPFASVQV
jgi:hypothetical protein